MNLTEIQQDAFECLSSIQVTAEYLNTTIELVISLKTLKEGILMSLFTFL